MTASRYTWSKMPLPTGLARVLAATRPRSYRLRCAGEDIAVVDYAATHGGWCFYSLGGVSYNSLWSDATWTTLDGAKAACVAWAKAYAKMEG